MFNEDIYSVFLSIITTLIVIFTSSEHRQYTFIGACLLSSDRAIERRGFQEMKYALKHKSFIARWIDDERTDKGRILN